MAAKYRVVAMKMSIFGRSAKDNFRFRLDPQRDIASQPPRGRKISCLLIRGKNDTDERFARVCNLLLFDFFPISWNPTVRCRARITKNGTDRDTQTFSIVERTYPFDERRER